jgi:tetratricopeptide (TPR) repeat protein
VQRIARADRWPAVPAVQTSGSEEIELPDQPGKGLMDRGTLVAGRYEIDALAGAGGMASVYRAHDRQTDRVVAVKVLQPGSAHLDERFVREIALLEELYHPAIVRYLDAGVTSERTRYLVMEWLDGEDLQSRLRRQPLGLGESLTLVARVAAALAFVHARRIVHRDVKPANIFLPHGRVDEAKLLDFGVARWAAASVTLTQPGSRFGTPAYMSPEQVRGVDRLNSRTDTFSLGCVLYECLTGEPAFVAHDAMAVFCKILMERPPALSEALPYLPLEIDSLFRRMVAQKSIDRPRCVEVATTMERLLASLPESLLQRAPAPSEQRASPTLTGAERRVVHAVVAAMHGELRGLDQASTFTHAEGPLAAQALAGVRLGTSGSGSNEYECDSSRPAQLERIARALAPIGARLNALADGSLIAVLEPHPGGATSWTVAVDQAANAARCALRLRDEMPEAQVVVASARTTVRDARLVSHVIDRAIELLARARAPGAAGTPGEIRLDALTADLLGPGFDVVSDHERGFSLRGEHPRAHGTPARPETPFVGRERELARLTAVVESCFESELAVVALVSAPSGYGKSRLCREFLARVESRVDAMVWFARSDPMRADAALHVMADAVRSMLHDHALREVVARHVEADDVGRVHGFLAELLGLQSGPGREVDDIQLGAARHDPKLMGDQVRRACADLVAGMTRSRPLLLVIEDFHWTDRATVELLDGILHAMAGRPFAVVAFARPEYREAFPELWSEHGATELHLGRLPASAAETLARAMLGDQVSEERVAVLLEQAGGHPFYLEELSRHAASGHWDDLPETVIAMVEARLERLDPHARQILRAASVFGERFWQGGVAALLGDAATSEWLASLVAGDWIRLAPGSRLAGEKEYAFRHSLIRDVAYEMLTEEDQRLGHRLAGDWLARAGEPHAGAIADHFLRGDAPAQAVPFLVRAAEDALARNDLAAAARFAERAIEHGAGGELLGRCRCVQVEERIWRGSASEVAELGREAMALLPRSGRQWYRMAAETGIALAKLGRLDEAGTLAAELGAGARGAEERSAWLNAAAKLAQPLLVSERRDVGQALLAAVEAEVGDLEAVEPFVAADIHFARALRADAVLGDPGAVLEEMERCAACFEAIGDVRQTCLHRGNVGYAKLELGLYEEAQAELRAVMAMAERALLGPAHNAARRNLAMLLARSGAAEEARALALQAIEWFSAHQDARAELLSHVSLVTALIAAGELATAESQAHAALARLPDAGPSRALVLAALARIRLIRHQHGEALEASTDAIALLDSLGSSLEGGDAAVTLVHAEALEASGRRAEARAVIARAREHLLAQAAKIGRSDWRHSFLGEIPDHARILALAEAWEVP